MSPRHLLGRRRRHFFRRWHRRIGLSSAIFVFLLATTGLLINHADQLGLATSYVNSPWILDRYGIPKPDSGDCYALQEQTLCAVDQQLFLGQHLIDTDFNRIFGAVQTTVGISVGLDQSLLLLSADGAIIDRFDQTLGLPRGPRALASIDNQLLLRGKQGWFLADAGILNWSPLSSNHSPHAILATPISAAQLATLASQVRGHQISWQQLLLDLHSGRFLGPLGSYFMDAMAFAFVLMILSGTIMWWRRRG